MKKIKLYAWGKAIVVSTLFSCFCTMAFNSEAMDIQVDNILVQPFIDAMNKQYNLSILSVDTVEGRTSIRLQDSTPKEVIKYVVAKKGGSYIEYEGKGYIFTKHKQEDLRQPIILRPKYISVGSLQKALSVMIASKNMASIESANALIIHSNLQEEVLAKKILQDLDKQVGQVNLEVYVIALQHGGTKERGVQWSWHNKENNGMLTERKLIQSPFQVIGESHLYGMLQSGKGKIVAKPNIVAQSGTEAHILIGDKVPVLTEHGDGKEQKLTVTYEEAGISLRYTPHISEEGIIDAQIEAAVSTPHLVPELKAYRITTRQVATRVTLADGEALVIGGLMDQRSEEIRKEVPLLSKIPILGKLFAYTLKSHEEVELLLVLRGHIEK